ncbi:ABC transporter permease [uncultured Sphingomonas sp.]|uniref:ABC transporter permease n=1 Tax=uncultured Sphingomonas sp. TaxID=158754 RepID=UPI0035C987AA
MIARLAWAELRQQVGSRVFWIVFAVSVLMVSGAMLIDELRIGLVEQGTRTGAEAVIRTHLVWTLFFLFTAAALVGEAVLRDEVTGFADLVRTTPVDRGSYALGRFVGAFGAVVLCFLSVPVALAVSGLALGYGTGSLAAYLFAFFALALPNLFLAAALFFVLARLTQSMTGCLLGATALLTLYGLSPGGGSVSLILAEPFAFSAIADATARWNTVRREVQAPAFEGALLANRVLWLAVASACLIAGIRLARRAPRTADPRRKRIVDMGSAASASLSPARFARASATSLAAAQLSVRTGFEARRVITTPAFAALMVMGLASATAAASRVTGSPATIAALATSFQLVPLVMALFFAGELFWAEQEHNVASLIAATPARGVIMVLPKFLAMALIFLLLALMTAGAGVAVQLLHDQRPDLVAFLTWYVLPKTFEWLLVAALALFLQSLAPSKLAGWGYMVFYLIGSLALSNLGLDDPLYRYGSYPGAPLPPALSGAHGVSWYRFGWGTLAAGMVAWVCRRGLPGDPAAR